MNRSPAWFALNCARTAAVIAFCDAPTPAHRAALEAITADPQRDLFNKRAAHAGVATGGQPEPQGCGDAFLGVAG
uniref:Uncharacterized protein n=1 Tax=Mizugakiibacter sediminis TaxID=1475481 RepID=A0A0S6YXF5_9GAMM